MKCGVYLLEFDSDKFYLGSTNDLDRRIAQHRSGLVRSTKRLGRLLGVAGFQACSTLSAARNLERKYKSWKSSAKVLAAMRT
ncbi:excinuclease ABC subunit C [bacterium]|nr:excinuclease ABC subunit C [bacterium]